MNIHKNMEVIFVIALAAVGLGSYVLDYLPEAEAKQIPLVRNTATPTGTAIVLVRAPQARGRI